MQAVTRGSWAGFAELHCYREAFCWEPHFKFVHDRKNNKAQILQNGMSGACIDSKLLFLLNVNNNRLERLNDMLKPRFRLARGFGSYTKGCPTRNMAHWFIPALHGIRSWKKTFIFPHLWAVSQICGGTWLPQPAARGTGPL